MGYGIPCLVLCLDLSVPQVQLPPNAYFERPHPLIRPNEKEKEERYGEFAHSGLFFKQSVFTLPFLGAPLQR